MCRRRLLASDLGLAIRGLIARNPAPGVSSLYAALDLNRRARHNQLASRLALCGAESAPEAEASETATGSSWLPGEPLARVCELGGAASGPISIISSRSEGPTQVLIRLCIAILMLCKLYGSLSSIIMSCDASSLFESRLRDAKSSSSQGHK